RLDEIARMVMCGNRLQDGLREPIRWFLRNHADLHRRPLHPRKEAMRFAGEKRVESENRAVKAILRDGYRPRRRELAVHPVVSERRQRQERPTIGVVEEVTLRGSKGDIRVLARIDTGAARTSLDTDLAARAGLAPVFARVGVRGASAHEPDV